MKRSKVITHQPKSLENPNIIDTKSVFIEYSKTFHKLRKSIKQAENVSQVDCAGKNSNNPLNSKSTKK